MIAKENDYVADGKFIINPVSVTELFSSNLL